VSTRDELRGQKNRAVKEEEPQHMAEHKITLNWAKGDVPFTYDVYPRNHQITFKNGKPETFSAAPVYKGDPSKGDPEDMLVAALSSCHMLSFLAIAAKKKFVMTSYEDDAVGYLENKDGKLWMTRVILRPQIVFENAPDAATLEQMHHMAHEQCFIANSVKTDVSVEIR
jgi:organic hydroperoxide reductase OsmC/OhrA